MKLHGKLGALEKLCKALLFRPERHEVDIKRGPDDYTLNIIRQDMRRRARSAQERIAARQEDTPEG